MQGFLGLSRWGRSSVQKKWLFEGIRSEGGCAQLFSPAGKGLLWLPSSSSSISSHPTSVTPFPSSLATPCWSTWPFVALLSWYLALRVWHAVATPEVLAVAREICLLNHHSWLLSTQCPCLQDSPSETPCHISQADAAACCEGPRLPRLPLCSGSDRDHGPVTLDGGKWLSYRDGETDTGLTNTEYSHFFIGTRKTRGSMLATFPSKTGTTCWEGQHVSQLP